MVAKVKMHTYFIFCLVNKRWCLDLKSPICNFFHYVHQKCIHTNANPKTVYSAGLKMYPDNTEYFLAASQMPVNIIQS